MKQHIDIPFNPPFKQRLGAIWKLMFFKEITFRFEWNDKKKQ